MLAIITKMTLTQVSTWFANARRRLKKENKMTWTPRNRSEDEEEDDNIDLERNDEEDEPIKSSNELASKNESGASISHVYYSSFKFLLICFCPEDDSFYKCFLNPDSFLKTICFYVSCFHVKDPNIFIDHRPKSENMLFWYPPRSK